MSDEQPRRYDDDDEAMVPHFIDEDHHRPTTEEDSAWTDQWPEIDDEAQDDQWANDDDDDQWANDDDDDDQWADDEEPEALEIQSELVEEDHLERARQALMADMASLNQRREELTSAREALAECELRLRELRQGKDHRGFRDAAAISAGLRFEVDDLEAEIEALVAKLGPLASADTAPRQAPEATTARPEHVELAPEGSSSAPSVDPVAMEQLARRARERAPSTTMESPGEPPLPPINFKPAFLGEYNTPREVGRRVVVIGRHHNEGTVYNDSATLFIPAGVVLDLDELVGLVVDNGWPDRRVTVQINWDEIPPDKKKDRYLRRSTLNPVQGWRGKPAHDPAIGDMTALAAISATPITPPTALETVIENSEEIATLIQGIAPVLMNLSYGLAAHWRAGSGAKDQGSSSGEGISDDALDARIEAVLSRQMVAAMPQLQAMINSAVQGNQATTMTKPKKPKNPAQADAEEASRVVITMASSPSGADSDEKTPDEAA